LVSVWEKQKPWTRNLFNLCIRQRRT